MDKVAIRNATRNAVIGDRIEVAATSLSRLVGLLGRRSLEAGTGLLIVPSQGIHTIAMRFAIDVVFLDRNWRVIHLQPAMAPFRVSALHWTAWCVLELPVGSIARTGISTGDQLMMES